MLDHRTVKGAFTLSNLASRGISGVLRNSDGTVNWRLISILGLGVALLGTILCYRQDKQKEKFNVG